MSPHRNRRPWQGAALPPAAEARPAYDAACYLCPGNARAGGEVNPQYDGVYVFRNDFPALLPEGESDSDGGDFAMPDLADDGLFRAQAPVGKADYPPMAESQSFALAHDRVMQGSTCGAASKTRIMRAVVGECRVVCYSPRHDLTLAQLSVAAVADVAWVWRAQYIELARRYRWVQIFENKGEVMGCSNPHPHGQIWACDYLPNEAVKEHGAQARYWRQHGRALLGDYAEEEAAAGARVVLANADWLWLTPFWAVWPFETMLICRRDVADLAALDGGQLESLAAILKEALAIYDRVFGCDFPYSMGWHNAPAGDVGARRSWRLHAHFYPPLLRSESVRKYMVGFEMLAEPQRDWTPEQAAERLRSLR